MLEAGSRSHQRLPQVPPSAFSLALLQLTLSTPLQTSSVFQPFLESSGAGTCKEQSTTSCICCDIPPLLSCHRFGGSQYHTRLVLILRTLRAITVGANSVQCQTTLHDGAPVR